DQESAAVATRSNGGFVVTWVSQGQDGSGWGVYARGFASAGNPRGGDGRVNSRAAGDQLAPSVAVFTTGDFVAAWASLNQDGSGCGVYAPRFDPSGNPQGGEFRVNTTTAGDQQTPSIAMEDIGGFVVSWASQGQDGSGSGVYAQRYDAAGNPRG